MQNSIVYVFNKENQLVYNEEVVVKHEYIHSRILVKTSSETSVTGKRVILFNLSDCYTQSSFITRKGLSQGIVIQVKSIYRRYIDTEFKRMEVLRELCQRT